MADNRPRVNSSTWHRARKVERPKRKSTATIKRVPLAQKIDKKITLDDVLLARSDLEQAFEWIENIDDENDKLTVLKAGYMLSTKRIPNYTKPKKQWHLFDALPYQSKINFHRSYNLEKIHPNMKLDAQLKQRQRDLLQFEKFSLQRGITYLDDMILLDEHYRPLTGIKLESFIKYITPYRNFLWQKYMDLNKDNFAELKREEKDDE